MKLVPFPANVKYHAFAVEAYTDINMFAWGNHNVNHV
jgi:hypothetical protein